MTTLHKARDLVFEERRRSEALIGMRSVSDAMRKHHERRRDIWAYLQIILDKIEQNERLQQELCE